MSNTDREALTLDVDWAPDWAIDRVAGILVAHRTRATWFATHRSDAVDRLSSHGELFEVGIHPNLAPGSTHGAGEDEVLGHLRGAFPEAVSMRTHGLRQSSDFLVKANKTYGIEIDVSLFLPRCRHLAAHRIHWFGARLWRLPYFWEDDSEMFEADPLWRLSAGRLPGPGLQIFNFHPIHVVLNTESFPRYQALKQQRPLAEWDRDFIEEHKNPGRGSGTAFLELAKALSGRGRRIMDLVG